MDLTGVIQCLNVIQLIQNLSSGEVCGSFKIPTDIASVIYVKSWHFTINVLLETETESGVLQWREISSISNLWLLERSPYLLNPCLKLVSLCLPWLVSRRYVRLPPFHRPHKSYGITRNERFRSLSFVIPQYVLSQKIFLLFGIVIVKSSVFIGKEYFIYICNKIAFQYNAYRPMQWPSQEGGCLPRDPLWTKWLTDRCKNIPFPQLLLRTVMNYYQWILVWCR